MIIATMTIRRITRITTTATHPPSAIAAASALTAETIAFAAATTAFTTTFAVLAAAFAAALAASAAFFAAFYSEILAITRKEPSTLYLYPSIVPLIPGDLFCYVAFGIVWRNTSFIVEHGPDLALSLVGISIGFVLCSSVVHYVRKIKFLRENKD